MTDIAAEPQASPRADADENARRLAARVAAFQREQVVVDYANRGVTVPEIAARLGVPVTDARQKLRAALARALPDTPEDFAALQMNRLNEALLVAFSAMETMGLKAVDRALRIVRALDRQHAAARPLASLAAPGAREEGASAAPAPDAASAARARNRFATQPLENTQNRSQTVAPAPTPEAPAETPAALLPREAQRNGRGDPCEARWRGPRREARDPGKIDQDTAQHPEIARSATDFGPPLAGLGECAPAWPLAGVASAARVGLAALFKGGASARALAAAGA